MSAKDLPLATSEREQLLRVVKAAEALVSATADYRMPQDVRDQAFRARYAAWGALNDYDAAPSPKGA